MLQCLGRKTGNQLRAHFLRTGFLSLGHQHPAHPPHKLSILLVGTGRQAGHEKRRKVPKAKGTRRALEWGEGHFGNWGWGCWTVLQLWTFEHKQESHLSVLLSSPRSRSVDWVQGSSVALESG
jgi:hypothetical protein